MQTKATLRYHCTPIRMAKIKKRVKPGIGECMEQPRLSFTADENAKWYSHYGKQLGSVSQS